MLWLVLFLVVLSLCRWLDLGDYCLVRREAPLFREWDVGRDDLTLVARRTWLSRTRAYLVTVLRLYLGRC